MTDQYFYFLKQCIKNNNVKTFYKRKEWRQVRAEVLAMDNYECQKCKHKKNKYTKATCVHHINHVEDFPEYALDIFHPLTGERNLISLCNTCHNEEHPEKRQHNKETKEKFTNLERW